MSTGGRGSSLSTSPAVEHFKDLVDLDLPVLVAAGVESVRDAVLQMIDQRRLLNFVEGSTHGADLRQHVDAVTLLLDHARHAAHLAFDPAEAGELGFLEFPVHGLNYTPVGYKWQA